MARLNGAFTNALRLFSLRFSMLVLERLYVRSCDGGAVVRSLSDMIGCSVGGGMALEGVCTGSGNFRRSRSVPIHTRFQLICTKRSVSCRDSGYELMT
jgi:hypothetical protein